jgi:hypothetical protein
MRYCTTAESKDNKHTMQHELDIMPEKAANAANEQITSLLAQQRHTLQPHLG